MWITVFIVVSSYFGKKKCTLAEHTWSHITAGWLWGGVLIDASHPEAQGTPAGKEAIRPSYPCQNLGIAPHPCFLTTSLQDRPFKYSSNSLAKVAFESISFTLTGTLSRSHQHALCKEIICEPYGIQCLNVLILILLPFHLRCVSCFLCAK